MKTAFIFPGQGSQSVGMGKEALERSPVVRHTFEEADDALGTPLSRVILEGPLEVLTETENTQPALLTVSVAYARLLAEEGVPEPDVVAGHSLGEYSALVVAGALSFSDAVRLTRLRGQAMQRAVPLGVGTMAAFMGIADPAALDAICAEAAQGQVVEPAGYNCPGQLVVAGHVEAVDRACEIALARGAMMAKRLNVSAPFHCSLLTPAGERLRAALREVRITPPRMPYVPNVEARLCSDADGIPERLITQVSRPVLWEQGMRAMLAAGVARFAEVGAGRTLVGLAKRIDRKIAAQAFEGADLAAWLKA
ncbi:ACP S-malonyltransferase [Myxococcota bacterium]|nr:ACP S-malonyltransferase [Myxococcota bacterium]